MNSEIKASSNNQRKIFSILGPTCTGKTKLSLDLAKKLNAEIINVDSLLFYQELNVGTCKPSLNEIKQVPHHLIDINSFKQPLTAADYVKLAVPLINQLLENHKKILIVGGSGFYVQALLKGMYSGTSTPPHILLKSEKLFKDFGIKPFMDELKIVDPIILQQIHPNDYYRLRRAIEYFWSEGKPFSAAKNNHLKNLTNIEKFNWNYQSCFLNLTPDEHFPHIQKRTEQMLSGGLIEEVQNILKTITTSDDFRPLASIGYAETIKFLKGEIKTLTDLKEEINISTRQLAKAQRTWFKYKLQPKLFHPLNEEDDIINLGLNFFKE